MTMDSRNRDIDYSLYLVTDSTPAILGDKNLCDVVEKAILGGVTVVQYRDKTSDTGVLISTARKLHGVTRKHNVPLLINDRVDVALAVGCEGVHLGQDDMDITTARSILGQGKVIGISANSTDEAAVACEQGADYLGIGTIFSTQTKKDTKSIIGPAGLSHVLDGLYDRGHKDIPTVCIGGITVSNIPQIMFRGCQARKALDGVAVVSAIVAAEDPESASRSLLYLVRQEKNLKSQSMLHPGSTRAGPRTVQDTKEVLEAVPGVIKLVHDHTPLTHNMTNLVVQNFAANVALAIGASPIMANYGEEAADLAKLGGALVINMGTVTPEGIENYKKALKAYNAALRPVVLDPVGAGATAVRRTAVRDILSAGYVDVIKGNESEIKTVYSSNVNPFSPSEGNFEGGDAQRGVDSSSTLTEDQKVNLVAKLASREDAIVVMTGKTDFVSDGERTFAIENGHAYLGMVTGTGCTLGTTISAMVAAATSKEGHGDKLVAVVAGLLLFEMAAEEAALKSSVEGPGSFVPAFLDSLYQLRMRIQRDDGDSGAWLYQRAKLTNKTLV